MKHYKNFGSVSNVYYSFYCWAGLSLVIVGGDSAGIYRAWGAFRVKKLIVDVTDLEKATYVKAVRLEKGRKLAQWVRDSLNDAATLEIAQRGKKCIK